MEIGGWNTEAIAKYYIGATSSGQVQGGKRKPGQSYAEASWLALSPEFEKHFTACARQGWGKHEELWVDENVSDQAVAYEEQNNKTLSNDATKYGREHGLAQEASSKSPILPSNGPGHRDRILHSKIDDGNKGNDVAQLMELGVS